MRVRSERRAQDRGVAGKGRLRRWALAGLLMAAAAAFAVNPPERAAAERPSPDEVEAAYLFNFGKFVRWPAAMQQEPLTICVAGDDAMSSILTRLMAGETIAGRTLEAKRLDRPAAAGSCSILYISAAERGRQNEYLAGAEGKPVLTVGEAPDFLARGGMIQFVLTGNHVRFSVNLAPAGRCNLQLSSELLKVAVSVRGQSGGKP